jgi:myo-inositol-1(or 4)-monophosphatase
VRPGLGGPLQDHHWRTHTQVHTADDQRAGLALERLFTEAFPGHGLVIEDREELAGDGRHRWYIDPIDGSANHLRGIPYVSVTAGLEIDGEPVVGIVHDIIRDVTWSATAGGGARVRDADGTGPTRVAGTRALIDAMVIAHLSRRGPLVGREGALRHMLWHVRKLRCMGSIALDLGLLAAGEADLLVVGRGGPQRKLDIVGGLLVLREAGGVAVDADGGPLHDEARTLVAGPPGLCAQFVELMAAFELEAWTGEMAQQAPTPFAGPFPEPFQEPGEG